MISEVSLLVTDYFKWLKDNTILKQVKNNVVEITTPFLDRHNDHIQLYVQKKSSGYVLTDLGYVLTDLKLSGLELKSHARQKILEEILNGFGILIGESNELFVEAKKSNFPQKKHDLIQAILAVNDLFVLSTSKTFSFFIEDVERFFEKIEVRYTKNVKIEGKSKFSHKFEFIIPKSKSFKERLLRTVNRPSRQNIESLLFTFSDVLAVRDALGVVILNDENEVNEEVLTALKEYDLYAIKWSERNREENKELLKV